MHQRLSADLRRTQACWCQRERLGYRSTESKQRQSQRLLAQHCSQYATERGASDRWATGLGGEPVWRRSPSGRTHSYRVRVGSRRADTKRLMMTIKSATTKHGVPVYRRKEPGRSKIIFHGLFRCFMLFIT